MASQAIDKRYMPRVPASQCSMCSGFTYVGGYEAYCYQCLQELGIAKALSAGDMSSLSTPGLRAYTPGNVTIKGDREKFAHKRDTHPNKGRLATG